MQDTLMIRDRIIDFRRVQAGDLAPSPKNWRKHPPAQVAALKGVLAEIGWADALLAREVAGHLELIDGHLRAGLDPQQTVPVLVLDLNDAEADKLLATLDPLAAMAQPDQDALLALLRDVQFQDRAVTDMLEALANGERFPMPPLHDPNAVRPSLADRFLIPPFSVLDARQGYWQDRKRQWLALGIRSELGRGETTRAGSPNDHRSGAEGDGKYNGGDAFRYRQRHSQKKTGRVFGQDLMRGEHIMGTQGKNLTWVKGERSNPLDDTSRKILSASPRQDADGTANMASGTSIFDPVLCEVIYRWFCPAAGSILDPFAGGSVRGIVAGMLGHSYTGIDLRSEQAEANERQVQSIKPKTMPRWIVGDSRNIANLSPGMCDLIFSCPPYFDLERYSGFPADLSNADGYVQFLESYRTIIAQSITLLRPNRFACFIVGDIRDKKGFYRNFVSDTIAAFQDAGMILYNEAILVTELGSLSIRVGRQFAGGRKLGKTHQNVLIFYKGDPKRIAAELGKIKMPDGLNDLAAPTSDPHEAMLCPSRN